MDNNFEIGLLYLIKNGKVISKPLHTNKMELAKIAASFELKRTMISPILGVEEYKDNSFINFPINYIEIYKELLEDGYSVIRETDNFEFTYDDYGIFKGVKFVYKKLDILIAPTIDKTSYQQIINMYNDASIDINDTNKYIYNLYYHKLGLDYDYLDYGQTNKNYSMFEKLDFLLRQKTDSLNKEEQYIFDSYRNFDLASILTREYEKSIIDRRNAGIIIITPNKTYEKNVTKLQHGTEIKWCLEKEGLSDFNDDRTIWELVDDTNSIIVQLANSDVIIWLNNEEHRTPYQQMELDKLIDNLNNLKEQGYKVDIVSALCKGSNFEEVSLVTIDSSNKKRAS